MYYRLVVNQVIYILCMYMYVWMDVRVYSWAAHRCRQGISLRGRKYKSKLLILDTWNLCTLLDEQNGTDRPRRRTALVASKLNKYNIDIAALSETRLAGEDSLIEVGQGRIHLPLERSSRRHPPSPRSRLSH